MQNVALLVANNLFDLAEMIETGPVSPCTVTLVLRRLAQVCVEGVIIAGQDRVDGMPAEQDF